MKTYRSLATLSIAIAALNLIASHEAKAQFFPTEIGSFATNTSPYLNVGKITATFRNSAGRDVTFVSSATTIRPYSALTAGHCIYHSAEGWLRSGTFERAKYYASVGSRNSVTRAIVAAGYTSNAGSNGMNTATGFSFDAGAIICSTRPNNGGYAGNWANTTLLTGTAYNMSLGYGAENHDGQQMLKSAPTRGFTKSTGAYYTNTSYRIEGGMSGGPVFAQINGSWYVCAINVSGSTSMAGVRALDAATTQIMNGLY